MTTYSAAARTFNCTAAIADTLNVLASLRAGGIATIHGYRPTTGYKVAPTVDSQVITRFSTARLYARKVKALEAVTFADISDAVKADAKLAAMPLNDAVAAFEARKAWMLAGLTGERTNAHTEAHTRCYVAITDGVKVNLHCVKDADGIMQPVLDTNGLPTAESIMVAVLELNRVVVVEGERKPEANSGIPVRISNAIDKVLNRRSVGYTTRTLKADNFTSIKADGRTVTAEDVSGERGAAILWAIAA